MLRLSLPLIPFRSHEGTPTKDTEDGLRGTTRLNGLPVYLFENKVVVVVEILMGHHLSYQDHK